MSTLLIKAILAIDEPLMIYRKLLFHELGREGLFTYCNDKSRF